MGSNPSRSKTGEIPQARDQLLTWLNTQFDQSGRLPPLPQETYSKLFGTPLQVRPYHLVDNMDPEAIEAGGGPSFELIYRTPLLEFVFQSHNVGRAEGHATAFRMIRNETDLLFIDGWQEEDALLTLLMENLIDQAPNPWAMKPMTNAFLP